MVTSDFIPEMEIWPFRACAMKNMQYNSYLRPNRRNSRVLREIGVEENDCTWRQILDRKWHYSRFAHARWKMRNINVIYGRIAEISALYGKLGSRNSMVTSVFTPEMKCSHFAHAQWKLCNISTVSRVGEISACYMKLLLRSTMVTSYFSSAMGQISCSTERIASFH